GGATSWKARGSSSSGTDGAGPFPHADSRNGGPVHSTGANTTPAREYEPNGKVKEPWPLSGRRPMAIPKVVDWKSPLPSSISTVGLLAVAGLKLALPPPWPKNTSARLLAATVNGPVRWGGLWLRGLLNTTCA